MGGLAGADGSVFPGMTFGFAGMGMGIVGRLVVEREGVFIGRGRCWWEWEALALPAFRGA